MKALGTVTLDKVGGRAAYAIEAAPHVMMRLKRILPRVNVYRTGAITVVDTPEVARDLTWILDRWPMDVADDAARLLEAGDTEFRARSEHIERVLAGYIAPPGDVLEPARPAREYQTQAEQLALLTRHLLLADDVGLGKTFTSLLMLRHPGALPALVVTLTHLPEQWLEELAATLPWLKGHIVTTGKVYDPASRRRGVTPDVLIMNYHKLAGWADHLAGVTQTVIFDEAQELRRESSNKYVAAAQVAHKANYVLGLTATPVYNYGAEIWNIMDVLAPGVLGTREEFGREWCSSGVHGRVADPAALGLYLREQGVMLRRERSDPNVKRELPPVDKVTHHVPLDDDLGDTSDLVDLALRIVAPAPGAGATDAWRAAGDLDWRLRRATGLAKAPYVADFVNLILEAGEPVLLFGWHIDVYAIWEDRLAAHNPAFFTGQETAKQKHRSEQAFLDGDTNLLIMSLRSGAGLDGLQKRCRIAVFGELDWSPGVHDQCIGRLNRDGQADPVSAYFLVADDGADPVMAEVLNLKRQQSEPLRNPQAALFEEVATNSVRLKALAADFLNRRGVIIPGRDEPESGTHQDGEIPS